MILAFAMEQGGKMALIGVRNPLLGKADVSAAQSSSPGKVRVGGQWSKEGLQAVLGLVAHSSDLSLGNVACLRPGTIEDLHAALAGKYDIKILTQQRLPEKLSVHPLTGLCRKFGVLTKTIVSGEVIRFKRQARTWDVLFQNLLNNHYPITYCGSFKSCVYGGDVEQQR